MRPPLFRKHHRFFLTLFIASRIFLADGAITLTNTTSVCCPSFHCGDGVEIKYPFTASPSVLGNNSDYYCGYRELSVTCQGDKPIFKTYTGSYIVKRIDKTKKTISLVDADVWGEDCPRVKHSLDISSIPMLSRPSSVVDLLFFFNCSQQNINEVVCLSEIAGISYVFDTNLTQTRNKNLTESCQDRVTSTVLRKERDSINGNISRLFGTVLQRGFDLQWRPIFSDCIKCENSGGYCGYKNKTHQKSTEHWRRKWEGLDFTCFCYYSQSNSKDRKVCKGWQGRLDYLVLSIVGLVFGICLLAFIGCGILIYKRSKRIQKKKLRRKNFNQNNRQLEMKLISSHGDTIERTKIITLKELKKATNNFDKTRIIGEGGHGTVYKGLLSDQRVTAIKTSKVMNQIENEEFINEVALLSRIYHRNVVMLYGCCLETEVPLLVYEFISNGTLSDHLHVRDRSSYLCWDDRLRIATEVSGAIAYLHSASSKTIFHRDLKSANILLDEKLTAKLSDFGASKYVGLDQTHITATVQGTIGYLDPEYYQSGKLTEKSDVYSLGVILVELFTGKKPISNARSQEERNIIIPFIKLLNENQVEQIFDTCIVKEATKDEIEVFARLAGSCLRFKGEERPTMKEVVSTLEGIVRSKTKQKGQIYQEEAKNLQSFDIYKIESSSGSTTMQQNPEGSFATAQSYI